MERRVEYSVTQLNAAIRELLEAGFSRVFVMGEVSNLRRPASGHVYFTLKDDKSQIRAVLFRSYSRSRSESPLGDQSAILEEGAEILCLGRIGVYQERGEYQLVIEWLEPRGYGALQRAFEKLKMQLEQEGLFAKKFKTPLPFLPRAIGVVTSPTGSVIRDILQITKRRYPNMDIYIAPTRVQGSGAAEEIVRALAAIEEVAAVEVIILARGGGSLEDLASFNDERVARAIFACRVPVVSAVGHETDYTIADFVADLRAPTPSAAAEMVVPMRRDLAKELLDHRSCLVNGMSRLIQGLEERLARAREHLRNPRRIIEEERLHLDDRSEMILMLCRKRLDLERKNTENLHLRLEHKSPMSVAVQGKNMLEMIKSNMIGALGSALAMKRAAMSSKLSLINNLNPLAVLMRGYSIATTCPDGLILKDSSRLEREDKVQVQLARGRFEAKVTKIFKDVENGQGKIRRGAG